MNNRDYKKSGAGTYYHIFNRGNNKNDIFLNNEDFNFFLLRLKQNLFPDDKSRERLSLLPENSFSLISYCLMSNHFHLLLRQNGEISSSKLLSKLCTSYSKYFNKKHERIGHLFQDQFKQVMIDDNAYLVWLTAYIHQNPKVANLVDNLEEYRWSSYPEFVGLRETTLCDKSVILEQYQGIKEFKKFTDDSYKIIKNNKVARDLLIDI